MLQLVFDAIGTRWVIEAWPETSVNEQQVQKAVLDRIESFDATYSRFRSDSLVTRMSQKAGTYVVPDDAENLLTLYLRLYELSGGTFTPLIASTLVDAGYDANYSLIPKTLSMPPVLEDVLEYSHPYLTIHSPVLLDFGAAGKGYLVDIIGELLESFGINSYVLDAGGDVLCRGTDPVKIGLENPVRTDEAVGVAYIHNQSICGSAGNRRTWSTFHHIIDPFTLQSPTKILGVWVVADKASVADGLSTCLYLVPPSLFNEYAFQYLIVYDDFSIEASPQFPAELFIRPLA